MKALDAIKIYKSGDKSILKTERWLMHLALAEKPVVNLERLDSLSNVNVNYTLDYVEKTLECLDEIQDIKSTDTEYYVIESVLKWAEVAKTGNEHNRNIWKSRNYNLYIHNLGSAEIYETEEKYANIRIIIAKLIQLHGLIGQYIRGETTLYELAELRKLGIKYEVHRMPLDLDKLLYYVTQCVISAVSKELWNNCEKEVRSILFENSKTIKVDSVKTRMFKLRQKAIASGEKFEAEYKNMVDKDINNELAYLFRYADLWYVEAATYDFSFEEFCKMLLLIPYLGEIQELESLKNVSFERIMQQIYYQHDGKKTINVYVKRIIENYLKNIQVTSLIRKEELPINIHVQPILEFHPELGGTGFLSFKLSSAGQKLIEFAVEAEHSGMEYENATLTLFDFFGLRKDDYDRISNESHYLTTMNKSVGFKKLLLDYIALGHNILDIGPGGGALLDLLEEKYPFSDIAGIDISSSVVDELQKRKERENKHWQVVQGDALNLHRKFKEESIDTIIFCSIIHELFSYIETDGKKFNHKTIADALKSAYSVLSVGGRIIIRDGIMSEPTSDKRVIKFISSDGISFLNNYIKDFKGRKITYELIGKNTVKMKLNDAMEFLYTYTWGENSYAHEVQEQFGYFTPKEYEKFIHTTLGASAKIIELKHYLQDGYSEKLAEKIEFFYEDGVTPSKLPDSTSIIVIEKAYRPRKKPNITIQTLESNRVNNLLKESE